MNEAELLAQIDEQQLIIDEQKKQIENLQIENQKLKEKYNVSQ